MTNSLRPWFLVLVLFLCLPQTGWGNWIYSGDPNGNGTQGYFGFKANVIESDGNFSTSTAVLTSFSGPATQQLIPPNVTIGITVNPGAPDEHPETVTCTVRGFENFTLASKAHWTGDVNIIGTFHINGNDLTVNSPVKQQGPLYLGGGSFTITGSGGWVQSGNLTIGEGGLLVVPGSHIHHSGNLALDGGRLEIGGDYIQGRDTDGNGTYETYCQGRLTMTHAADYMLVVGKALFHSYDGYSVQLTAGTLEVRGDFEQKDGYGANSYRASSTHRTLLSGSGTQTVVFATPSSSYFGILEVKNHLADASIVSVVNGGILKLDYNGTDIISSLTVGGVVKSNGLYDSSNTNSLITGTGKIQVGPFADFNAWTTVNTSGQASAGDHDHDGVPNGIEYFMGKSGSDFTTNPGIAANGTVTWPKSPAFSGNYAVQTSADLMEWTDVTEDPAQVTKNPDSVIWTRPAGIGSRFVRLVVLPN